ncbi:MAG: spore maturation protein [Eubacterium sp.]|jgi:spore maturation protein B|nr:spore maturation protein [Eubacterium sp.]NBI87992.1 spore maturation protein [Lachnospiraceae bacterium]
MQFLQFFSEAVIPITVFLIVAYGLLNRQNVFGDFLKGAKDGFYTVVDIFPTLVGLMCAVGILRASGFLDFFSKILKQVMGPLHFPTELIPVSVVKMFSSSAATGLLLDLFKTYGTDSFIGLCASIMMSCTETIFYTMSIYFMHIHVKRTRFTLSGALFATICGIAASVVLASFMV